MSTPVEALLTDIAVIGMAGRFPGARTADEFWENVRDGVESIQQYSDADLLAAGVDPEMLEDSHYVKAGAPVPDMEHFDGSFFGFSPLESSILDPQHRLFLEVSWEALEHAGHVPEGFLGLIGVFAGSGHHSYLSDHLLTNKSLVRSVGRFLLRHTGNDKDFMVTRVSYLLDLRGPSVNIQTACSTSLVAIHAACQSLLNGECDMALAGGVTVELPHRHGYKYAEGEILSPDGHCRAFDAGAHGTVFGSGVGIVVLRRLSDAIRDRDTILAVVKGSAVNNDGAQKVGYLAPSVDGVARCIAEALAVGSVDPATVSYVEAHGTGTSVGDPIELSALKQAFHSVTCKRSCGIGSVKTNIGHLDTAAGVASLIKVVQALRHRQLPPSLNFEQPNPACELDESPFYVQSTLADWKSRGPRRAGVTSLGVGGTNAHVVLEEAPPRASSRPSREHQLLVVSARTPDQLDQAAENLAVHLSASPNLNLADVAHTLRAGRRAMKYRRAVVTASICEAPCALRRSGERGEAIVRAADTPRPVVFMFAGGGAQYVNMSADLYKGEPAFSAAMDECLTSLAQSVPYEWKSRIYPRPGSEADAAAALERPSVGLPALFATQYAQARTWMAWGIKPSALIGHSMGEYTAAHLAGVLTLEEALQLVWLRGRLFETLPAGGMLSVAIDPSELRTLMSPGLDIAAINAPTLCVASGPVALVRELQRTLTERGVDTRRVRVAAAAHSRMVDPILDEFRAFFSRVTLRPAQIPLVSNATGTWLTSAEAVDSEYWVGHLRHTVRFAEGLRELCRRPWDGSVLLEVGPGRTLASLAQVHPDRPPDQPVLTSARHPDEAGSDVATMLGTLGRLWSHGVAVDWTAFTGNEQRHKVPLPTYPFARTRHWVEAHNGRDVAREPASGEGGKRADIGSWFYSPRWQRRRLLQSGTETHGGVIIFADDSGVGEALAERLRHSRVRIVRPGGVFAREGSGFTVPLDDSSAYVELLRRVLQEDGAPESIIHLLNLSPPAAGSPRARLGETMSRAFSSLLHLAQAIGELELTSPLQLTVVSSTLQWVSRDDTVEAEKALLLGPVRVIPREYSNVRCQSIDVVYPQDDVARDRIVTQLVAEIGVRSSDPVVAYREADRYVQTFSSVRIEEPLRSASRLRHRGVYLITGGLGGVGLTLADHLARSFQARLILVGRSALPLCEQWDKWLAIRPTHDRTSRMIHRVRAMEALGAEVLVASADVAKLCEVQNVMHLARKRFGRIDGVFHTAGVLQDGIIQLKDRGTVGRVLDPKVAGTLVLDEALTEPLDFMVLFSSVSALNGLPGQVDYAAANAFLDAFAHRSSTTGNRWTLSVNWSAWQEVGMAAAMARELGLVLATDADGKGSEPITHPLFVRHTHEADAELYAADLTLERTWILNEHRLRNRGVLPGTGYLELVRAAVALRHTSHTGGIGPHGSVEFRDVVFVRPFLLGSGEVRGLQVRLGPALEFSVLSTSPPSDSGVPDGVEHAKEHARGRVEYRPAAAPAALPLAAIKDRCGRRVEIVAGVDRERHMHFGARWNNLRSVHYGMGEALATLQLPEEFTGDLDDYPLHPALLDMATAGAQPLIEGFDAEQHFYVPFSYGRLVMHAALKPNCVSHITYKGTGTLPDIPAFDVTIADESGTPLVTISDFVMKRVYDTHVLADDARPLNRANRILEHSLRYGIAPAEGMSALERILGSGTGPQVIVSPQDLRTFLSLHEAAGAESETSDRPPEQRRQEGPAYEAPQTPTERRICKLLQDLLGIEQVGVRDNFFELGGHSLLAVRLFAQLHKSTGVNLPLATLFEAPTPRLLAGRFNDAAPRAGNDQGECSPPQSRDETATPTAVSPTVDNATGQPTSGHRARTGLSSRRVWSSLVALQPDGSRPPFFSIHGRGGNVLNYAAFVEHLGSDQPLYGLQCRGLDGSSEPFQSLPEMAAAYVEEIRTVQPTGPYFLGGGSMGGTVALEMAQQLQAKAERVALVAMFDTYGPHYFEFYAPHEMRGRSGSQTLDAVRHHARKLQALSAREGYDYIQSRASARVHDKYKHWMCSVYRMAGLPLPHTLRYFALERLNVDMLLKYVPETYTGRIVLFRALAQPDGVYQEPMLGWSSIARGPFEVVNIPGTHNNLIEQPMLGQQLRVALRQAQQAAESGDA